MTDMKRSAADITREYGPFPEGGPVHGVSYDGTHVWFASGGKLNALNPVSGEIERTLAVPAHAGTAFDGKHLYQIAQHPIAEIQKIDVQTGKVVSTLPVPKCEGGYASGLAWAEGSLWVGDYGGRQIHQVDPQNGAVLRTLKSNRFVTGITWVEGELWHGTLEGDASELRRVDPKTGEVLETLVMPQGSVVSGMESDGGEQFFCGGAQSGTVRAVRRPKKRAAGGR